MSRILSSVPGQTLLPAIQQILSGADEALLAVAFVDTRGIHLLEKEMKSAGSIRLLATSQFDRHRSRTDTAFARVTSFGASARLLNPKGGTTFHPKIYMVHSGRTLTGVIGSANLTFGLAGNFETGVLVEGAVARDAWTLAEQLWNHTDAIPWTRTGAVHPDELDPGLLKDRRNRRNDRFPGWQAGRGSNDSDRL